MEETATLIFEPALGKNMGSLTHTHQSNSSELAKNVKFNLYLLA